MTESAARLSSPEEQGGGSDSYPLTLPPTQRKPASPNTRRMKISAEGEYGEGHKKRKTDIILDPTSSSLMGWDAQRKNTSSLDDVPLINLCTGDPYYVLYTALLIS
jgi:hypothetical protein